MANQVLKTSTTSNIKIFILLTFSISKEFYLLSVHLLNLKNIFINFNTFNSFFRHIYETYFFYILLYILLTIHLTGSKFNQQKYKMLVIFFQSHCILLFIPFLWLLLNVLICICVFRYFRDHGHEINVNNFLDISVERFLNKFYRFFNALKLQL